MIPFSSLFEPGRTSVPAISEELKTRLDRVCNLSANLIGAESTAVLLAENCNQMGFKSASGPKSEQLLKYKVKNSQGIAGACLRRNEPVVIQNAYTDPRFEPFFDRTTGGYSTSSIAAIPIALEGIPVGVIESVNAANPEGFSAEELGILHEFAEITEDSLSLATKEEKIEILTSLLPRTVNRLINERSPQFGASLLAGGNSTVMFVDMVSSSEIYNSMNLRDCHNLFQEHFSAIVNEILKAGGDVVQFSGDGLLAIFTEAELRNRKEAQALEAAMQIQSFSSEIKEQNLKFRIGIDSGFVTLETYKAANQLRANYTGKTLNICRELEKSCLPGGILCSKEVLCKLPLDLPLHWQSEPVTLKTGEILSAFRGFQQ